MSEFFRAVAENNVAEARTLIQREPAMIHAGAACPGLTGEPPALAHAARYGHTELAEMLLAHGADIDAAADENRIETPINVAAWFGHAQTVEMLLRHNPALFVHYTPAHWAYHGVPKPARHQHVIDLLRRYWLARPEIADARRIELQADEFAISALTVKTTSAMTVAFITSPHPLTPAGIWPWYSTHYEQHDEALTRSGSPPIGPAVWRYRFVDDQRDTFFLDVAWPVPDGASLTHEDITVGIWSPVRCASVFLLGRWEHMGKAWQSLREQAAERGLRLGQAGREVYHFPVGPDSSDCISEVQFQLADA